MLVDAVIAFVAVVDIMRAQMARAAGGIDLAGGLPICAALKVGVTPSSRAISV